MPAGRLQRGRLWSELSSSLSSYSAHCPLANGNSIRRSPQQREKQVEFQKRKLPSFSKQIRWHRLANLVKLSCYQIASIGRRGRTIDRDVCLIVTSRNSPGGFVEVRICRSRRVDVSGRRGRIPIDYCVVLLGADSSFSLQAISRSPRYFAPEGKNEKSNSASNSSRIRNKTN
jgi:hypothetical protein